MSVGSDDGHGTGAGDVRPRRLAQVATGFAILP